MCAVTEWLLAAVLAAAEKHPLARLCCVSNGCDARVLVASITEGLLAALATSAPEVGFALFYFDWIRRLLRYDGWCHVPALASVDDFF